MKRQQKTIIFIALSLFIIGSFLRIYFFVLNRSLWFDEAMLALNLVNRSWSELLQPLDYNQGAPLSFLLVQKALITLLGPHDYILRLLPLAAGLLALFLMYPVGKRYVGEAAMLLALSLFALASQLIYYSSEVKQYSTDVLMTVLVVLVGARYLDQPVTQRLGILALVGSVAVWSSHPALFVVASAGIVAGLFAIATRNRAALVWLFGVGMLWGIQVAILYLINFRYLQSNDSLLTYWQGGFAPSQGWRNLRWYYDAVVVMLKEPAFLPANLITMSLILLGIGSLAFRRWPWMLMMVLPFVFTFIAATTGRYPFSGRLILFLLPLLFLLIAEGTTALYRLVERLHRAAAWIVISILTVYLLALPVTMAYQTVQNVPLREDIKPGLAYIRENKAPGDLLYIYYGARYAFMFYAEAYGFVPDDYALGIASRDDPSRYHKELAELKSRGRIWLVFTHNYNWGKVDEEQFILAYLDTIGFRQAELLGNDASVYLYMLHPEP